MLLTGLGADADLLRLAGLAGAAPRDSELLRRAGARTIRLCGATPFAWSAALPAAPARTGLALLPVELETVLNTRYPAAANDGLLWQGRGFAGRARAGVFGRAGVLSAALAPELAWQQNAWFATLPTGEPALPFANPFYPAVHDAPQRFGAGPYWSASPGQSYVRVDAFGVGLGLSTENRWLGPGARTAILLTDAGPGFPHAFLGTSAPVDFGVGGVEVLALWGRLDRSRHAGPRSHPWFTALALGWEPRWTPGFHVGAARAFVESAASLRGDAFLSVVEPPWKTQVRGGDNPDDNQLATLWFRWVLPESALELYGEWGKDDFPASVGALLRETERTQAWLLGVQKVGRAAGRPLRVRVEFASFTGGDYPFYVHTGGLAWTNDGQPLGSYAGPGGLLAGLELDTLAPWGRLGGFVERLERNETVFESTIAPLPARSTDRDTELSAGLRGLAIGGAVAVSFELAGGYRWNRDFGRNEPNVRLALGLSVRPPGASGR